jgi:hypothetical protein
MVERTDCPGKMNRDAISLQKEKILYDTQRTPMKANAWVVGAAQGSIGLTLSMFAVTWDVALDVCSQWTALG